METHGRHGIGRGWGGVSVSVSWGQNLSWGRQESSGDSGGVGGTTVNVLSATVNYTLNHGYDGKFCVVYIFSQ